MVSLTLLFYSIGGRVWEGNLPGRCDPFARRLGSGAEWSLVCQLTRLNAFGERIS